MRFQSLTLMLIAPLLLPALPQGLAAQSTPPVLRWQITGRTMGPVPYSVVIANPPSDLSESTAKLVISAELDGVNELMSTYQPDSDVSRFNDSDSTEWFPVDVETAQVIARALEITTLTGGAFDIRVAAAVQRWNFGPNKQSFTLPSDAEIAALRGVLSNGELSARLDPPAIKKSLPEVRIDLSAIAKGYASDQVAAALLELGCQNMMVEIGGEVVVRGYRSGAEPWRLGVEKPDAKQRGIQVKVSLTGRALATSGDYRNYIQHQGKRYSHTIDPATAKPVEHFLASATVVADDCLTADAIATAVMVLGAERGHALAQENSFELLTLNRDGGFDGPLKTRQTDAFPLMIIPETAATSAAQTASKSDAASIWPTFLAALLVFSIAIAGMAVGAIFANKPVTGSCGGLSAMSGDGEDDDASCSVCAKPVTDCVERQPETQI